VDWPAESLASWFPEIEAAVESDEAIDMIPTMGWTALPYGCVGIARNRPIQDDKQVWSWLILVPWAANDSKPWIDGVEIIDKPLRTVDQQREMIQEKMRTLLDDRYGESFGQQSVEQFLRELGDGS
jgi:hypothetical protein